MLGGLTGSEDKDLSGNPAWKMTGPMPAEGRMDDDEENTNLIYRGGRKWKAVGVWCPGNCLYINCFVTIILCNHIVDCDHYEVNILSGIISLPSEPYLFGV